VKFVNVFDDFKRSDAQLYYRTDSHWTQEGIDIAYEKTIEFINQDSVLRQYIKMK